MEKSEYNVDGFRVRRVTQLHECGETAIELAHKASGLQWLHFLADDPVSSCAIGVVTPVTDDCGLPHVLEHMVFTGSKKRPGTDLMRGMLNRTVAESMNGCTCPFMTNYFFNSAVESDMRAIFEVWFDAILRPELSDAAFYREAGRFMPQNASRPDCPLAYTGIVFNEMRRDQGGLPDRIINEAKRLLVPDSCFGFNPGGCPSAIMTLSPDDVRDYHARWYRPANMRIITRGRGMPQALFAIADKLLAGVEAGEAAPPFVPQPRWEEPRSATIYIPSPKSPSGKSEDEMPNRALLWLLPGASDPRAFLATEFFFLATHIEDALNAKPELAILENVHNPRARRLAEESIPETHYKTMSEKIGPDKCWGIYGHFNQDDTFETFASTMEGRLRRHLDDPETAVKIAETARMQAESIAHNTNENGQANLARKDQFESVFKDWIFKGDPLFGLNSSQFLAICHQFERDPDSAVTIVRDLLIGAPHRLDLDIREAQDGEDPESAMVALALKEMRARLSDEECADLARREEEALESLAAPQTGETLPETTLADIPDDRFAIPHDACKASPCGATFLTVKANTSGQAWLTGFADLSDFTSEQLLLIPIIAEAFEERMQGGGIRFHSAIHRFTPYAKTGIIDGVLLRGIQFEVMVDNENRNAFANEFATFFHLRDPLTFTKAKKMARFGSDPVKVRQSMLHDKVWATGDTAEKSLLNACSDCRALETLLEYRMSYARPRPQARDEMAAAFVREASETADLLHNPARWTFAIAGPKHLTDPLRESLLETLLSAPARPIGPVAELKFAPKKQDSEKREATSIPGQKVATISISIPAPAESTLLRRRLEIGATLLERDFAEPRIRKGLGAYVANFQWKENFLRLESRQNPDVGDTLDIVRSIRDFAAGVKWSADDVRQATLHMAADFVNWSQSPSGLVSRCLENYICGEKPANIRGELERIANMNPEDIRQTLLEALDAGKGRVKICVKASGETIAEANSVLPENLQLQVV